MLTAVPASADPAAVARSARIPARLTTQPPSAAEAISSRSSAPQPITWATWISSQISSTTQAASSSGRNRSIPRRLRG